MRQLAVSSCLYIKIWRIKMNLEDIIYKKAEIDNIPVMLHIIHRCMNEVNYKDYNSLVS